MEKIILADGTEREVPTAEELTNLNAAAQAKQDLEAKVAALNKAKQDADNDPVQKNWNAMRATNESLKAALKAQGKEVREDGTIIDATQPQFNQDEIINKATTAATVAAQQVALDNYKRTLLSKYNEEDKKVIEHYYTKLSAGEQLDFDTVDKLINEAARLVSPNSKPNNQVSFGGQPPRFNNNNQGQNFSETEAGKSIANEVFGDSSFAKAK
jgi:hypothetical protein